MKEFSYCLSYFYHENIFPYGCYRGIFLYINIIQIPTIIKCNISVFLDAPKLICLQYRLVEAIDQQRRDAISRASCRFAIIFLPNVCWVHINLVLLQPQIDEYTFSKINIAKNGYKSCLYASSGNSIMILFQI